MAGQRSPKVMAKASSAGFVRREVLLIRVEVEDPTACLSQQVGGAEGSLIRVVPGRVGAALTKPGRVSTARWCGSGERDGKEYARNRRCYVSQRDTGSNLADLGRSAVRDRHRAASVNSEAE